MVSQNSNKKGKAEKRRIAELQADLSEYLNCSRRPVVLKDKKRGPISIMVWAGSSRHNMPAWVSHNPRSCQVGRKFQHTLFFWGLLLFFSRSFCFQFQLSISSSLSKYVSLALP